MDYTKCLFFKERKGTLSFTYVLRFFFSLHIFAFCLRLKEKEKKIIFSRQVSTTGKKTPIFIVMMTVQ
jgi:hypothetical protein